MSSLRISDAISSIFGIMSQYFIDRGSGIFKDLVSLYSLAREGVFATGGYFLPYSFAMGRLITVVGLWPYGQHFYTAKKSYQYQAVHCCKQKKQPGFHFYLNFSTSFCFYSQLIFTNLKWMNSFLLFHL